MKKAYVEPQIEVFTFDSEDVITESIEGGGGQEPP